MKKALMGSSFRMEEACILHRTLSVWRMRIEHRYNLGAGEAQDMEYRHASILCQYLHGGHACHVCDTCEEWWIAVYY